MNTYHFYHWNNEDKTFVTKAENYTQALNKLHEKYKENSFKYYAINLFFISFNFAYLLIMIAISFVLLKNLF